MSKQMFNAGELQQAHVLLDEELKKRNIRFDARVIFRIDKRVELPAPDRYVTWDAALACGKSYMVGDRQTTEEFLRGHTTVLSPWQRAVYSFLKQRPDASVSRPGRRIEWCCYCRGEYVRFDIPHHDRGGEKGYISRDGRTKVLINVD